MGREALARAKALEAELRKLAGSGAGPGSLDAEPWFQSCARTVAALPSLGEAGLSAELAVLLVGATASPTDFSSSAAAPDSHKRKRDSGGGGGGGEQDALSAASPAKPGGGGKGSSSYAVAAPAPSGGKKGGSKKSGTASSAPGGGAPGSAPGKQGPSSSSANNNNSLSSSGTGAGVHGHGHSQRSSAAAAAAAVYQTLAAQNPEWGGGVDEFDEFALYDEDAYNSDMENKPKKKKLTVSRDCDWGVVCLGLTVLAAR
jgi:hypothetical protein